MADSGLNAVLKNSPAGSGTCELCDGNGCDWCRGREKPPSPIFTIGKIVRAGSVDEVVVHLVNGHGINGVSGPSLPDAQGDRFFRK